MRKLLLVLLLLFHFLAGCDGVLNPPQQRKLADLKTQRINFTLQCPRGKSFRLLLGVPEAKVNWLKSNPKVPQAPPFQGQVTITQNSKQICTFPISSAKTTRSNWLEQNGLEGGYIIDINQVPKGQDVGQPLDKHLQSGETYQVAITFSKQPSSNTSLWLSWLGW